MALAEKFLAEIGTLKADAASETLQPETRYQNAFGFGRACGIQEGLRMAEELLNKLLVESEDAANDKRR